jgi:hypothetical protein
MTTVIGVAASMLGGGIVASVLTYLLNGRRARHEFLATKLEATYDAVRLFAAECRLNYIGPVGHYLLEETTFESMGEKFRTSKEIEHRRKTEMLIRLYFLEAKPAFDELNSTWTSVFRLCRRVHGHGDSEWNEMERTECLNTWNEKSDDFENKVATLEDALLKLCKQFSYR